MTRMYARSVVSTIGGMQPVITAAESGRLDMASTEPVEVLMDRAGLGVALAAVEMGVGYGSRVAVLAGRGNNGGDGYVAARYLLRRGAAVTVHSVGFPKGDYSPARKAATAAVAAGASVERLGDPVDADLVIDALFGAGFRGSLPDAVVPWTETSAPVLAVDVPSGLNATTGSVEGAAFTADRTVTFHALKTGHLLGQGPDRSGAVSVTDIGLSGERAEFLLCDETDAPRPVRARAAHKWSAGSVLVVGGSPGLTGAAMLAATAALNAGAGAAAIATPGALQAVYASLSPGVMSFGIGSDELFSTDDAAGVLDRAARYDVLIIGPGLGPVSGDFVRALLRGTDKPVVLDADGLNALAGVPDVATRPSTVITPHTGEFRRLVGEDASYEAAATVATDAGITVVLKGNPTFVLGDERWVVTSGGSELATIGTGDVLSGVLGAYWAGGLDGETAARSAAYRHGVAGRTLAARQTVTAEALASEVGREQPV